MGVLRRTIGRSAEGFDLTLLPKRADGLDAFTVEAKNGRVAVAGTSAVAICRGAYEYLRDACHVQVNWSGSNVAMPGRLPDYARRTVVCPNQYRHYFNICTFGYSAVWWDWKRWQHEVDWMALHGINMPLALNGQEKIWQRVFRSYGLPDSSISRFFSGPAFLPWHWMGNLNEHGGPMPQSWIDGQVALQKKILKQERELGMTPVVSGFSGFVPVDFDKYQPGVKLSSPTAWAGFAPTTFVDVRNPKFVEIGKRYITEYRKEFGTDHFYLCDTFNEQNPQFSPETEKEDLAACGRSVYESIRQADPQGTWIMQGWLFYNARDYWTVPRVNALVSQVPKGRMVVLDLATSEYPVWKHQPAVRENGWIYNTLHNYGQSTGLFGALQYYADHATDDLNDPTHGRMLGMGLTMEGIDQNPVVYELMTDLMWRRDRINVKRWIGGYARSRYGGETNSTRAAWSYLLDSVYNKDASWARAAWRQRPNLGVSPGIYDIPSVRFATVMLDSEAERYAKNPLFERDLVDVAKTWLGGLADVHLVAAVASFDDDKAGYEKHKTIFFDLLHDMDRVMAVRPEHRLSTWIRDARSWGRTPEEKDRMEWNARMQVTIWGGPVLYDYANKEWAGLNEDFLRQRWQLFFDALEKGGSTGKLKAPDYAKWEEAWTRQTNAPRESKPEPVGPMVREMIHKYGGDDGDLAKLLGLNTDPGIAVGAKVRDSGGTEGNARPELAVDGHIDTGYWAASPAPRWLEIDLGHVRPTTGARIFPYYGDGRSYLYRIEVSEDGQNWRTVADASANELSATIRGHGHKWPSTPTRFLRVTMLHNSANVGVHLYEVRVFDN
ncbi:alpha-N-acetylglucosaminidase TIM-barrel domain-containing protein [Fimbriimonas ginsengisoli]|uniref:Alpha-N-acetylglucosaminidase n=1 Tax=Fimbriimonas ginsengisoli Gsoil 348 TaxID=661478 RepID=A0A068NR67_FIMGI|nr:alpha-N-acetylglucosaminidase TIM-barrel domain-containing protein [Fimbriimonas ginsengisoli]AIE85936.1 Alpha-N-acetylglucosaminidase [Fimbriimonas ginsengisoli Gsoil 348]